MALEQHLDAIRGELAAQLGEHRAEVRGELALLRQEFTMAASDRAQESQRVQSELARIGRTLGQLVTDDLRGEIAEEVKAGLTSTIRRYAGGLATAIATATAVLALIL